MLLVTFQSIDESEILQVDIDKIVHMERDCEHVHIQFDHGLQKPLHKSRWNVQIIWDVISEVLLKRFPLSKYDGSQKIKK